MGPIAASPGVGAETVVGDLVPRELDVVARFAEKEVRHSGRLLGESKVANRAALVEVPLGQQRVVLIGFRCQFCGQTHGTYRFLFNALP